MPAGFALEAAPGVEEGVNSASRAGAPGPPCPAVRGESCRGNAAPGGSPREWHPAGLRERGGQRGRVREGRARGGGGECGVRDEEWRMQSADEE